jgi:hypothetical protein
MEPVSSLFDNRLLMSSQQYNEFSQLVTKCKFFNKIQYNLSYMFRVGYLKDRLVVKIEVNFDQLHLMNRNPLSKYKEIIH